ncbi:MAG: hypothetical protein ABW153_00125, partial [Sedimenticola sp.]
MGQPPMTGGFPSQPMGIGQPGGQGGFPPPAPEQAMPAPQYPAGLPQQGEMPPPQPQGGSMMPPPMQQAPMAPPPSAQPAPQALPNGQPPVFRPMIEEEPETTTEAAVGAET